MTKSSIIDVHSPLRIYYAAPLQVGRLAGLNSGRQPGGWSALCDKVSAMGFNCLLTGPLWLPLSTGGLAVPDDPDLPNPDLDDANSLLDCLVRLSKICAQRNLSLMLDLTIDRAAANGALAREHRAWYDEPCDDTKTIDPRRTGDRNVVRVRMTDGRAPSDFIEAWSQRLSTWAEAGVGGFRCDAPHRLATPDWQDLMGAVRNKKACCRFLAWTPGLTPEHLKRLAGAGFDATFSSLPWWDYRAPWLAEEHARLRAIAPVIALVENPEGKRIADARDDPATRTRMAMRALWTAAATGDGLMLPMGFEDGDTEPLAAISSRFSENRARTAASANPVDGNRPPNALCEAIITANRWMKQNQNEGPPDVEPPDGASSEGAPQNRISRDRTSSDGTSPGKAPSGVAVHNETTSNGTPSASAQPGRLYFLTGANAGFTTLLHTSGTPCAKNHSAGCLAIINPSNYLSVEVDWRSVQSRLPDGYGLIKPWERTASQPLPAKISRGMHAEAARAEWPGSEWPQSLPGTLPDVIPAAGCVVVAATRSMPVILGPSNAQEERKKVAAAIRAPRIAIENITPSVDNGRFPAKRTIGEPVRVEADVFMDGHDKIAVRLLWRAADETAWQIVPMQFLENDRWQATFWPARLGKHYYLVQASRDAWATYRDELQKKNTAGLDVSLEVEEGRDLISAALERVMESAPHLEKSLAGIIEHIGAPLPIVAPPRRGRRSAPNTAQKHPVPKATEDQITTLLSDATALAMQAAEAHGFETTSDILQPVMVERSAARFASWYELFPRSQTPTAGLHGRFDDVARRLPAIRDMGFDVLYFPPIHPIGLSNRKGKNNTLGAGPHEPGSPYAIGSSEGGHDAIHPDLGSLDDFRRLLQQAHEYDLEIALDFAIQCSPDHPWLTDHPEWYDWRADGSLRHAENPPKRYEDIVNVDFYGSPLAGGGSRPIALWCALRDVVLFWVEQGVRMFRVDNPHTKPLPFWEWLIADIQSRHPDVLFLSEAFTRPKMMYRLAKVGFSQSYTYFTWRETKQDLTDYLIELNQAPAADIFRPHFFVNTPDINPRFLQTSGRPGFLIRAALATTMSGLWGMYNGFELCEARALPGKEEYLDSEKYEIRLWDWDEPGNIIGEISELNRIRRSNPALQTHLGLRFHVAHNNHIIFFSKSTPQRDNIVLVAISLDPHVAQTATLEVPLWDFGLPDHAGLNMEDLFDGHRFTWYGKYQTVELTPDRPFAVWRVDGQI